VNFAPAIVRQWSWLDWWWQVITTGEKIVYA